MIFSSIPFVFAFLPIALIGYYVLAKVGRTPAAAWLIAASLFFYGYWSPIHLLLLLGSIAWNFAMGKWIFSFGEKGQAHKLRVLWAAILGNLVLLFYYKYLFPTIGFLSAHNLAPAAWETQVVLPLGISFFTFTQIGYLVDCYDGKAKERGFLTYALFVTFFPHLIAGPIVHNREIMPQFADREVYRLRLDNLAIGIAIFTLGIAKKVLLADPLGFVADSGFDNPASLGTDRAWLIVLSYSLQLYFDFSGYSDMAIGLARMFGIVFPVNFDSPYKATSIIDFWSRWHITLTRYLTLYLYNPIGLLVTRRRVERGLSISPRGTRNLPAFSSMVMLPTFFTMGLAGIWHGAGLQFLIFGLLHATYLTINHAWRIFGPKREKSSWPYVMASVLITYAAVLAAQIFFRASSVQDAITVMRAMAGLTTASDNPTGGFIIVRIVVGFAICLMLPNTQQIMMGYRPILERVSSSDHAFLRWRPSFVSGLVFGTILLVSLIRMSDVSKFLYFQF